MLRRAFSNTSFMFAGKVKDVITIIKDVKQKSHKYKKT